nr:hypothetical protein Hi04_10k_c5981_00007 [uncultured bacterium]
MKILAATLVVLAMLISSATFAADSEIERELKIAPVPLKYDTKDRTMVARGSYIANALGGCVSCHTMPTFVPGGDPFKGEVEKLNTTNYLAGGKCFGPIKSPNITPDDQGHPGGLTLAQFVESIRGGKVHMMEDGKKPDPNDVQKVMPWPEFRHMSDNDLSAVYAYLSAISHADPSNTKCPQPPKP